MDILFKFEKTFVHSWWVILSLILCFAFYEQEVKTRNQEFDKLAAQMASLKKERKQLENERDDLLLQLHSLSDPAWIELTLIKILGLVPEGHKKIYFAIDSESEGK